MAGRGPAPKDPSEVRRRNVSPELVLVAADDQVRGPELPDGYEWPEETRAWWQHWRESPQSQVFIDTDWSFLLDTALLHADLWLGDLSVAGELRLRVAKFGATAEDRRRLRLAVGEPPAATTPPGRRLTSAQKARMLRAADSDPGA
jgi:hypothetical protein